MTKLEFVDAIESKYQCEALNDMEGFQLYTDGFWGDITILINNEDTFDINIDIFDECYDMRDGTEKYNDTVNLAYYKSVCSVLEGRPVIDHKLIKSQSFDLHLGVVYTAGYLCNKFDIELINHIFEALKDVDEDWFYGDTYKQALLETISNDDDYNEDGFIIEDNKLWFKPKGNAVIFTADIGTVIPGTCFKDFVEVDDIYLGLNYAFLKNTKLDKMVAINCKYIETFNNIVDQYEIGDIKYFSDFKHFIYAESEENLKLAVVIQRISGVTIINEYELLSKHIVNLRRIAPTLLPIRNLYDFSLLRDCDFEMLCFELLNCMGFQNVRRVGETNAPDGGRDILADKKNETLSGVEWRKWIFQCKHSKKSLGRKDISEIVDLVQENNAQGYGLFCSNSLTSPAIDRLEHKKGKLDGNVEYYGKSEMTFLIDNYPDLAIKYRLVK